VKEPNSVYDFEVKTIKGESVSLGNWKGKVLLIVNTASQCGLTPQYEGLESLYRTFKDRGLVVLGFPCNQFGAQEPGFAKEIEEFCTTNYKISFPMFDKIDVNGPSAHPLYVYMKNQVPGVLGTEGIKWNFTKFLVDRSGKVVDRFAPTSTPDSLIPSIEAALGPS
jgi:glutathione peroxidase